MENVLTSKPKAHNIALLLSTMHTDVVFRIFCLIVLKTRRRLRRRHCVMQFLFSIRKPIILSSRNMRRTDRNIHAGMVIMVRRSPVVDFEKTALLVCLHERFHHIVSYRQYLLYYLLSKCRLTLPVIGLLYKILIIKKKAAINSLLGIAIFFNIYIFLYTR